MASIFLPGSSVQIRKGRRNELQYSKRIKWDKDAQCYTAFLKVVPPIRWRRSFLALSQAHLATAILPIQRHQALQNITSLWFKFQDTPFLFFKTVLSFRRICNISHFFQLDWINTQFWSTSRSIFHTNNLAPIAFTFIGVACLLIGPWHVQCLDGYWDMWSGGLEL